MYNKTITSCTRRAEVTVHMQSYSCFSGESCLFSADFTYTRIPCCLRPSSRLVPRGRLGAGTWGTTTGPDTGCCSWLLIPVISLEGLHPCWDAGSNSTQPPEILRLQRGGQDAKIHGTRYVVQTSPPLPAAVSKRRRAAPRHELLLLCIIGDG